MRVHHHLMTWNGWLSKNKLPFELPAVLDEVKSAGYDGIEGGGDEKANGPANVYQSRVGAAGLQVAAWGASVTYNPWAPSTEQFQRDVDYAAALDVRMIVVCGGFMPSSRRTTLASDYTMFGDNLASHAQYAAKNSQVLCFHPHLGCVVETNREIELLIAAYPQLQLCIDTGHLAAAGEDPLVVLEKQSARIQAIHLKDWNPSENAFTELGNGIVDLVGIKQWMNRHTFKGPVIVERDSPPIPAIASASISRSAWASAVTLANEASASA